MIRKLVNDLGAGAYLMMHGFKPSGKQGKAIVFQIDEKEQKEFGERQMEYLSSEFHRFDACLMSLKKSNEYIPEDHGKYKTVYDLGAGAYAMMHGHKPVGRQGKAIMFEVSNPDEDKEFEQRTMEYLSSEFHHFDSCLMSLKKMNEYEST